MCILHLNTNEFDERPADGPISWWVGWLVWLVGLSSISSPALIQDFSNYKMIVAKIEARIRRSLAKLLTAAQNFGCEMSSGAHGRDKV